MIHETIVVGPLQCNCVLLGCERTKEAVLIDPGDEAPKILAAVAAKGLTVKYLLHTHAHFDHFGATGEVQKALGAPPCVHKADEILFNNLPMQGQMFGMKFDPAPSVEKFLEEAEVLAFGDHKLNVIHTPGHSPGSVCFRLEQTDGMLFSGDTLFRGSIGRADLWGGDATQLIHSIKDRLLRFEDEMPVHPGHGPSTRIGRERRSNPFLI